MTIKKLFGNRLTVTWEKRPLFMVSEGGVLTPEHIDELAAPVKCTVVQVGNGTDPDMQEVPPGTHIYVRNALLRTEGGFKLEVDGKPCKIISIKDVLATVEPEVVQPEPCKHIRTTHWRASGEVTCDSCGALISA